MEQYTGTTLPATTESTATETSIFDEMQPLPVYYSERAVYIFSVICGVLFGSVLMAINIKNTPEKKGIWQVIVFGVLFTAMQITIAAYLPKSTSSVWVLSIVGGRVLNNLFWKKFIGKNIDYTKRSVVVPAIVGVAFVGLIVLAIVSTRNFA